jgi:hypothetical protein
VREEQPQCHLQWYEAKCRRGGAALPPHSATIMLRAGTLSSGCRYEALAEIPHDKDWDEIYENLPEEIEGRKVVGVEDDFFVGGELDRWDKRIFTYSSADLEGKNAA